MFTEGYRTHRGVAGPKNFKKSGDFSRKIALPGFWDTGCHPSTLIDLVNTALARKHSAKNICMISEGYRTHTVVTGPTNFKKPGRFFSGKSCSCGFGAPGCHPGTLIDLVNTAPASKVSVKPKCMISEGYRTHGGVTRPMKFKKRTIFFGKSCSLDFGVPACHPSTLIDFANAALASKGFVKPICIISERYRTHGGVTGPMKFKKKQDFFSRKIVLPEFWGPWLPSKHFN